MKTISMWDTEPKCHRVSTGVKPGWRRPTDEACLELCREQLSQLCAPVLVDLLLCISSPNLSLGRSSRIILHSWPPCSLAGLSEYSLACGMEQLNQSGPTGPDVGTWSPVEGSQHPNEHFHSGSKSTDTLCLTPTAVKSEGPVTRKKNNKDKKYNFVLTHNKLNWKRRKLISG